MEIAVATELIKVDLLAWESNLACQSTILPKNFPLIASNANPLELGINKESPKCFALERNFLRPKKSFTTIIGWPWK